VFTGKTSLFNRYVYDEFGKTSMVTNKHMNNHSKQFRMILYIHTICQINTCNSRARSYTKSQRGKTNKQTTKATTRAKTNNHLIHTYADICLQTIGAYFGMKQCTIGQKTCNLAIWVNISHKNIVEYLFKYSHQIDVAVYMVVLIFAISFC
jgi:GTPase SAR1 family protein